MSPVTEFPIKHFLGLNLKDGGDRIKENEFTQLQNVWQPSKGIFARRFGSVLDSNSSDIPLAKRVSGVWRHSSPVGDNITLYHCEPDNTLFPDNTDDLVLEEVADGNGVIFGGGAIVDLRFCYSWVGSGIEQTYNSKNRAGFPGSWPKSASSNPAHQVITLANATSSVKVTVPAFPAGVTSANIFMARGVSTEMIYVGSVTVSAGFILVRTHIGSFLSANDPAPAITPYGTTIGTGGNLKPGTYYIGFGWVANNPTQEGDASATRIASIFIRTTQVTVSQGQDSIYVPQLAAASVNGTRSVYVFIGIHDPTEAPMIYVGTLHLSGADMFILNLPTTINAQTHPSTIQPDTAPAIVPKFWNGVNDQYVGGFNFDIGQPFQARFGFVYARKNSDANLREVAPSRTLTAFMWYMKDKVAYQGDVADTSPSFELHNYVPSPRTENDLYQNAVAKDNYVQPYPWRVNSNDPNFCYFLGLSYFANGIDIPWLTDGYSMGQLVAEFVSGSVIPLPPVPKFIFVYQNGLVAASGDNQVYGSNANNPQNWSVGGTGTALRYVSIGDAMGGGVRATGIFTPQTEATNDPNSFMIGFKKVGTWMIKSIPDPSSGIPSPMLQTSGRTGCVAYRSVTPTPLGTMFVGTDGNVYVIAAIAEPRRIGTRIQPALEHLVGNDAAMRAVTAVYHDQHYKISYPSAAAAAITPVVNDLEIWADLRTGEGDNITWVGPNVGRNIGPQIIFNGDNDNLKRLCSSGASTLTYFADDKSALDDLGTAITVKIQSKIFRFGAEAHSKRHIGSFIDCYIDDGYNNNLLFEGMADSDYQQINRQLSSGPGVWDASQWDQKNYADALWRGFSFNFGGTNLSGRTYQWRLTTADKSPFVLAAVTLLLKVEKRRIIA